MIPYTKETALTYLDHRKAAQELMEAERRSKAAHQAYEKAIRTLDFLRTNSNHVTPTGQRQGQKLAKSSKKKRGREQKPTNPHAKLHIAAVEDKIRTAKEEIRISISAIEDAKYRREIAMNFEAVSIQLNAVEAGMAAEYAICQREYSVLTPQVFFELCDERWIWFSVKTKHGIILRDEVLCSRAWEPHALNYGCENFGSEVYRGVDDVLRKYGPRIEGFFEELFRLLGDWCPGENALVVDPSWMVPVAETTLGLEAGKEMDIDPGDSQGAAHHDVCCSSSMDNVRVDVSTLEADDFGVV